MSATVIAGYSSFGTSKPMTLNLREVDDGFDSDNSEVDGKCDSDYSLSDIESGLDNVSLNSDSVRRANYKKPGIDAMIDSKVPTNSLKRLKKKRVNSNRNTKDKSFSSNNNIPDNVSSQSVSTTGRARTRARTFEDSSTCSEHSHSSNPSQTSRSPHHDYSKTTGTVKSLRRYKLAMEAYRKSAEKSLEDSEHPEQKTADSTTSPISRTDRSGSEKSRVFDWNFSNSVDEVEKVSHNANNNVNFDDISDCQHCNGVNLNLDYRSLLRDSALKRKKLDGFESNRASMDTDMITDIDIMVGLTSNESNSESDRRQSSEYDLSSPRHSNDFDHFDSYKSEPQSPEVITWPEYDTYVRSISSTKRRDYQSRFATLTKDRSRSALETRSKSTLELSFDEDHSTSSDQSRVNLRDKQSIRKRNLSSSNLLLSTSPQSRPSLPTLSTRPRNDPSKFHTISSSTRLGKLLRKQQQRTATTPSEEISVEKAFILASTSDLPGSIDENSATQSNVHRRSTLFVKNQHSRSRNSAVEANSRKLSLSSALSQSLPALRVITEGRPSNSMINAGPGGFSRQLSHCDINEMDRKKGSGLRKKFSTLKRKTTFAFSSRRRSLKPSDIVHTKLNTNNNSISRG